MRSNCLVSVVRLGEDFCGGEAASIFSELVESKSTHGLAMLISDICPDNSFNELSHGGRDKSTFLSLQIYF